MENLPERFSFAVTASKIRAHDALAARELGFTARLLAQTSLPHSDPGDLDSYERANGAATLYVQAGPDIGLPYGSIPRLLLAWVTTEAVRTGDRHLILGETLSEFMGELGLTPKGGRWGTTARLRDQMKRLLGARIVAVWDDGQRHSRAQMQLADRADLWWTPTDPDQGSLWESSLRLSEPFFNEIVSAPIPLDLRALKALRRSPLGLDLYAWLTWRAPRLKKPLTLSWSQLQEQFGADYSDVKDFAKKTRREMKRIALLWDGLRYETPRGRLILHPSPPSVPKLPDRG